MTLPHLVTLEDIHGILHAHTVRSGWGQFPRGNGGGNAHAGLQLSGITDHSQSAYYAGGMKAGEVSEQMQEGADAGSGLPQ